MVIISNGFSKFHLAAAAAEADQRHLLTSFLTGAYPTPLVRKILALPILRTNAKALRLAARQEDIPDKAVHALFGAEAIFAFEQMHNLQITSVASLRHYGRLACRYVEQAAANGARVYHYRAGFGGESIEAARNCGMSLLCDHSAVHPSVAVPIVQRKGEMPAREEIATRGSYWSYLQQDIELADAVLVNSGWVADTFAHCGHRRSPIHVVYLGVDDAFLHHVPMREQNPGELRLLFAGAFTEGKGAEVLIGALEQPGCWRLGIAGPVSGELKERSRAFFSNPRVNYLGLLSRKDLARAMTNADVFVFPAFGEGSARVIFEALACGCYVITTPNSGSIVEDGIHGAVVPPGDVRALTEAIEYAIQHRDKVGEIGRRNAVLVREKHRQCNYGDQLARLYRELAGQS